MAIKIRLRQQGRTNQTVYRLVLADVRSPRDGKYIEALGWYNPTREKEEEEMFLQADRIAHWIKQGAEMSEKVEALIARGAPAVITAYREEKRLLKEKLAQKRRQRKGNKKAA